MLANRYMKDERLGFEKVNNQGLLAKVIEYNNCHDIKVQFDDGTIVSGAWKEFDKGSMHNPNYSILRNTNKKDNRKGEKKENNDGYLMEIIKYNNANDIVVKFDNDSTHIVNSTYRSFKKGNITNPFTPSVYGVGIVGTEAPCMDGNKKLKEYHTWVRILERCYKKDRNYKNKTYENCNVSDEFLYYPNFYKWITSQENYEIWKNTPNFAVDKDIIVKGNKIYGAETCCLVPNSINNLIKPQKSKRGECMIGVFLNKRNNKYVAQCWNGLLQKNIFLGEYDKEYDAFLAYKDYKEQLIKETAELAYKDHIISKKCRDALLNHTVEVTD